MKIFRLNIPSYKCRDIYINKNNNNDVVVEVEFDPNCEYPIDRSLYLEKYGFDLSSQEIGNFCQHRKAWEMFLSTDDAHCMIIESNVSLNCDMEELDKLADMFSDNMDIFFPYDRISTINRKRSHEKKLLNKNIREKFLIEPYSIGFKWGNSVYFISRKGAKKLLEIGCIYDRLDNLMVTLSLTDKFSIFYKNQSWLSASNIDWSEWPERIHNMWDSVIKSSTWTEERKERLRILLKKISDIAEYNKIQLILQGGSHLGYVQHGGVIPWDDDVDIGINKEHLVRFIGNIIDCEGLKCEQVKEQISNKSYFKIWLKDGEPIENHNYTFPFVDLWVYTKRGDDLVFRNGIVCPNSAMKPFEKIIFEGSPFYLPFNSLEVLDSRYKYWRKKAVVYSWSHLYEKPYFRNMVIPIKTDKNGRMTGLGR